MKGSRGTSKMENQLLNGRRPTGRCALVVSSKALANALLITILR